MKNVLEYKGFIGSVNFSDEDSVFYGKIEEIKDLVTFEGESVQELRNAFHEMVDLHIADCEAEGRVAEKSYKGTFNVRISPELHKKASRIAISKKISLNQLVQKAIDNEVNSSGECCCG